MHFWREPAGTLLCIRRHFISLAPLGRWVDGVILGVFRPDNRRPGNRPRPRKALYARDLSGKIDARGRNVIMHGYA